MGATAVLPVVLTLVAFAAGVLVGWLWWGRQFVAARLTKREALSLVHGELEADLASREAEILRLRAQLRSVRG